MNGDLAAGIRRRSLVAAPALWLAAGASPAQTPTRQARIGVLGGSAGLADAGTRRNIIEPLRDGLRALGWVEGRNLAIEWRFAEGMPEQFDAAFAALQREGADGLLVLADSVFYAQRMRLGELVARQRLPSVWGHRTYLDAGGLASYQSDVPAMFRSGAAQVDKILRGAKPGEIPFEQATQLELVINLKAARALGIDVPQALRLQADEVIE